MTLPEPKDASPQVENRDMQRLSQGAAARMVARRYALSEPILEFQDFMEYGGSRRIDAKCHSN
jgi:hypothetical protein